MRKLLSTILSTCIVLSPTASLADSKSSVEKLPDARIDIHIKNKSTASYTSGLTPQQIKTAYGITGDGLGQTIAIVDAYGSPTISKDVYSFNNQFNLPPADLIVDSSLNTSSSVDGGWALETSLDVEWAHAVAPNAKIVLIEANSASLTDLLAAVKQAQTHAPSTISMSWGSGEFSSEKNYDSTFNDSIITYVASSGDNGSGVLWPSASPNVLSVGGTSLNINSDNTWSNESAWSYSGGGTSRYEGMPVYQKSVQKIVGSHRGTPDVSMDADPNTGVAVYDSTPDNGQTGWFVVGGTSLSAPLWASIVAIADLNRSKKLSSISTDSSSVQSLLYSYPYSTNDFHDITVGTNGKYKAAMGYDLVTGIGSPQANNLLPALSK